MTKMIMKKFKVKYYEVKYDKEKEKQWEEVIEEVIESRYCKIDGNILIFYDYKDYIFVKVAFSNFISVKEINE